MKLAALAVSIFCLATPFSFAQAACENEARGVIKVYLQKRGIHTSEIVQVQVQSLTPGSYWQRYSVVAFAYTNEGPMQLRFVMTSPFVCDDLSIESVH